MRRAAFILIFLLSHIAVAQDDSKPLPKHFAYKAEIRKSYDRFEDTTKLIISPVLVSGTEFNGLYFQAAAGYKGQYPDTTKTIYIIQLAAITTTPVQAKNAVLYAIIDGERAQLGEMKFSGVKQNEVLYTAGYLLMTSRDIVRKLAKAKKVEMRFDGIEFELTEEHKNSLLDLTAHAGGY